MTHKLMTIMLATCMFPAALLSEKPRVAVTGNDDSTVSEGIKLVQSECPNLTVNMRADVSNYLMAVSDDGSGAGRKGRRAVVTKQNGDVIVAVSTRSLKNAVKNACTAIITDWTQQEPPHGTQD